MSIEVIRPGLLTTVQDTGRHGFQKYGVITSGAMDRFALRAANILAGNDEHLAGLELTMNGPELQFHEDALIVLGGGDLSPAIDGVPAPMWRPLFIRSGSLLSFGKPVGGCRAYLAVSGGIDVPLVMDSRSTYLRAAIGGFEGRKLQAGDKLRFGSPGGIAQNIRTHLASGNGRDPESAPFRAASWYIGGDFLPRYESEPVIHALPGTEWHTFDTAQQEALFFASFHVLPQSDRMGFRLSGPVLSSGQQADMVSSPVSFGTIQVPPDGNPIVLMADHQTTGGYPRIAQIATCDLSIMAQVSPGQNVRFRQISFQEAEEQLLIQEMDLFLLKLGIRTRFY